MTESDPRLDSPGAKRIFEETPKIKIIEEPYDSRGDLVDKDE